MMLLHGIFFYSSPNGAFSCLFEGERLNIRRLKLGYGGFFLAIRRNFRLNICCMHSPQLLFYLLPPLFEWCLSFRGPIFFFSFESSSSSSKFKLKVSKGVCSCCENYHPFCPNFSLFKYHCFFTSFSPSKFIFVMLKFFDRIVAKSGFGFFLNIFKLRFIHLINYLVNDPLGKILNTFKIYLTQKT